MTALLTTIPTLIPGRDADVLAFHLPEDPTTRTSLLSGPCQLRLYDGLGGLATTGIQKLAQQAMIRLMTPLGGYRYEPAEGCRLLTEVLAQRVRNSDDAARVFAGAAEELYAQFGQDTSRFSDIPLDEQLAEIELLQATITGDTLFLSIAITSRSGDRYTFISPVRIS